MTSSQLKSILKDTATFIRNSEARVISYKANKKKYEEKLSQELMGVQEARDLLSEQQAQGRAELRQIREDLENRLDEWKELTISQAEGKKQSVKQDDLAELTLLGMLEVDSVELSSYADKYKHNPLALRMIEKIANDKGIMYTAPLTKAEKAQAIVSRLKMDIQYHAEPGYQKPDGHIEMVASGDIAKHEELYQDLLDFEAND
ncbi:hypothetical protein SDC9_85578 [bioreactor metagenome]|uniref:Uncharacterized protein n=1 Tax=bioreactor metagenome TaxID=1076179 RepID=A0A644ZE32_9ZZZZ